MWLWPPMFSLQLKVKHEYEATKPKKTRSSNQMSSYSKQTVSTAEDLNAIIHL